MDEDVSNRVGFRKQFNKEERDERDFIDDDPALLNDNQKNDPGLLLDIRLLTRQSMPVLWRNSNKKEKVPDCSSALRAAVQAKLKGNELVYEESMEFLVQFFTDMPTAAPARTPQEVRTAFSLKNVPANFAKEEIEKEFGWLDGERTRSICFDKVDVDACDLLKMADEEAERLKQH